MKHKNPDRKEPLLIAIGGGKGGVGKSMVSSNLAVQYAQTGLRVALLDLDFGAANLHTILGLRHPPLGLGDYFSRPHSNLQDFLIDTPIENLKLAPGSGFVPELADLKYDDKIRLIQQIKQLDAELILLDLGAGTSSNVIDFFSMTTAGIIVTTPEPTSVVNAYEFLKNVVYRAFFRMFKRHPDLLKIVRDSSLNDNQQETTTIEEIAQKMEKKHSWAAENLRDVCQDFNFHVIFNQAREIADVQLGKKLHGISKKYLGLNLNYNGVIFHSEQVTASVYRMSPISMTEPDSPTTKTLQRMAVQTLKRALQKHRGEAVLPFEEQYQQAQFFAQSDYEQHLLNKKALQRKT